MGEGKSGKENFPVLGEITNQLGQRGLTLVSCSPNKTSKSGIGDKRTAKPGSEDDSYFWKQVSKVAENLEKEGYGKRSPKRPKIVNESGLSPLSGGKIYRLQTSSGGGGSVQVKAQPGFLNPAHESTKASGSGFNRLDLCKSQTLIKVANLGDIFKERIPSVVVAESSKNSQKNYLVGGKDGQREETIVLSDSGENDCPLEALATKAVSDVGRSESVGNSRLIEPQEKDSHGLKRCTVLRSDGCSSSVADLELLKSCSCSFCTKAFYIWSDLHYQDFQGRVSVLAKSQKEASHLAERYSGESEKVKHSQGHPSIQGANSESDLMVQWKSLFHHMENIFASESSQLQADLLTLKDLRENFKMTSESIHGMPTDVEQCSFDASNQ